MKEEIDALVEELNEHCRAYYERDNPTISDSEFDRKYRRLVSLEKQYPQFIRKDSPTQNVGGEEGGDVPYDVPMLSLGNAFSMDDVDQELDKIEKLVGQVQYAIEPKLDGLACRILYIDGVLKESTTRGDGKVGTDITRSVKAIPNVPIRLEPGFDGTIPTRIEFRGEIVTVLDTFNELNSRLIVNGHEPYSSPRNYAAGIIRAGELQTIFSSGLRFVCYSVIGGGGEDQFEALDEAGIMGLEVNECTQVYRSEVENAILTISEERSSYRYDIDGAVIKVNSFSVQEDLGLAKKTPNWAFAYKYPATEKEAVVEDIIFQVGRTGAITPVAIISPTDLAGATVTRANLKNAGEIERLKVGIGAIVTIVRSGEVIPDIRSVVKTGPDICDLPIWCPSCHSRLVRTGPKLYCESSSCRSQDIAKLVYFVSKHNADIDDLAEKGVEVLYDSFSVKRPSDLYRLTLPDYMDALGVAIGQKVHENVTKSKGLSDPKLLAALGVPKVGPEMSEQFCHLAGPLRDFESYDWEALLETTNVTGRKRLRNAVIAMRTFLEDGANATELETLFSMGVGSGEVEVRTKGILDDTLWCVTGTLELGGRALVSKIIKDNGGRVKGSVTKETTHLLVGREPSKKVEKAKKLGIKIMYEEEFVKLVR